MRFIGDEAAERSRVEAERSVRIISYQMIRLRVGHRSHLWVVLDNKGGERATDFGFLIVFFFLSALTLTEPCGGAAQPREEREACSTCVWDQEFRPQWWWKVSPGEMVIQSLWTVDSPGSTPAALQSTSKHFFSPELWEIKGRITERNTPLNLFGFSLKWKHAQLFTRESCTKYPH